MTCDGLASRPGGVEILLAASCYGNRDKLRQHKPVLASRLHFTYFYCWCYHSYMVLSEGSWPVKLLLFIKPPVGDSHTKKEIHDIQILDIQLIIEYQGMCGSHTEKEMHDSHMFCKTVQTFFANAFSRINIYRLQVLTHRDSDPWCGRQGVGWGGIHPVTSSIQLFRQIFRRKLK